MKLGPEMYHVNSFHLQENEGGSQSVGGWGEGVESVYKKPWKNAMNLTKSLF